MSEINSMDPHLGYSHYQQPFCFNQNLGANTTNAFPQFTTKFQSKQSLVLLRKLFKNPNAEFSCKEQHCAVDIMLNSRNNMFVILPTGAGKSVLIWLACLHWHSKTAVFVVPTISLLLDMEKKSKKLGISVCLNTDDFQNQQIILLTSDRAVNTNVLFDLQRLAKEKRLSRIFLDEAHVYVTDIEYRHVMQHISLLRILDIPVILLTATASKKIQDQLTESLFPYSRPVYIRAPTDRKNIHFKVIHQESMDVILKDIAKYFKKLNHKERMIIYFQSIEKLENWTDLIKDFKVCKYHSKMPLPQRQKSFQDWQEGEVKVMLSTSGFGLGIDNPHVRYVIIIDLPYSFEDYIQQCGRAGRDGQASSAILYWNRRKEAIRQSFTTMEITGQQKEKTNVMYSYATNNQCRRLLVSTLMDSTLTSCFYNKECIPCDLCGDTYEHYDMDYNGHESCRDVDDLGYTQDITRHHQVITQEDSIHVRNRSIMSIQQRPSNIQGHSIVNTQDHPIDTQDLTIVDVQVHLTSNTQDRSIVHVQDHPIDTQDLTTADVQGDPFESHGHTIVDVQDDPFESHGHTIVDVQDHPTSSQQDHPQNTRDHSRIIQDHSTSNEKEHSQHTQDHSMVSLEDNPRDIQNQPGIHLQEGDVQNKDNILSISIFNSETVQHDYSDLECDPFDSMDDLTSFDLLYSDELTGYERRSENDLSTTYQPSSGEYHMTIEHQVEEEDDDVELLKNLDENPTGHHQTQNLWLGSVSYPKKHQTLINHTTTPRNSNITEFFHPRNSTEKQMTQHIGSKKQTPHTVTPTTLDAKEAAKKMNQRTADERKLFEALEKYKNSCPICLAKYRKVFHHSVFKCKLMTGKCLKCQGNAQPYHTNKAQCPLHKMKKWADDACYKCYFPHKIGGLQYHQRKPNNDTGRDGCPNDFNFEYSMALFCYDRNSIPFHDTDFNKYHEWLFKKHQGYHNIVWIFKTTTDTLE